MRDDPAAPRACPFRRTVVVIAPGEEIASDDARWDDALVVVEAGTIELEGRDGVRWPFPAGALLWIAGLPVRAVRNAGEKPATLLAVARRKLP